MQLKARPSRASHRLLLGAVLTAVLVPLGAWTSSVLWLPDHILYVFEGSILTIETGRPWWPQRERIDLDNVAHVYVAQLGEPIAVDGVQLPGYAVGRFTYEMLGEVWQATSGSHQVIVLDAVTRSLPVVVSPEEHETFLWAVRAGRTLTLTPPRVDHRFGWWVFRGAAVLPLLLTFLVPAIFFVAPGRLRYHITDDNALVVHTLLTGRHRFDLTGAAIRPHQPRLKPRGLAISIPGYHVGRFSDAGTPTLVFATSSREGLLVEVADRDLRLFLSPESPERLVDAVGAGSAHSEAATDD